MRGRGEERQRNKDRLRKEGRDRARQERREKGEAEREKGRERETEKAKLFKSITSVCVSSFSSSNVRLGPARLLLVLLAGGTFIFLSKRLSFF